MWHLLLQCELFSHFFKRILRSFNQVHLGCHEDRLSVRSLMVSKKLKPGDKIRQRFRTSRIVYQKGCTRILEISWHKALILLLTSGVPKLKTVRPLLKRDISRQEIDSYCRLNKTLHTVVLISNSSLTKRSMIEVLPTPESPRNTSLNLVSQRLVLSSVVGFFCINNIIMAVIIYSSLSNHRRSSKRIINLGNRAHYVPSPSKNKSFSLRNFDNFVG